LKLKSFDFESVDPIRTMIGIPGILSYTIKVRFFKSTKYVHLIFSFWIIMMRRDWGVLCFRVKSSLFSVQGYCWDQLRENGKEFTLILEISSVQFWMSAIAKKRVASFPLLWFLYAFATFRNSFVRVLNEMKQYEE
jgi:hypothetical protein